MGLIFILFLFSCAKHDFTPKEKSFVIEAGIATGLMMKATSCYAEVETPNVRVKIGSQSSDKNSDSESAEDEKEDKAKQTKKKSQKKKSKK